MNIKDIYNLAIQTGIENDFRPSFQIEKQLKRVKEKYAKLSVDEKEIFDKEKLTNPYLDSRIHFDNGLKNVKRVIAGIDADSAEVMVVRYLNNHTPEKKIDLIINHHP